MRKKGDTGQNQGSGKLQDRPRKLDGQQLPSLQSFSDERQKAPLHKVNSKKLPAGDDTQSRYSRLNFHNTESQVMNPDQRCAPDEDVVEDPYVLNKHINKLRILYLMRMGVQSERYQDQIVDLREKLKNLETLHDELIQIKRENTLFKNEMVNLHNVIKEQDAQNKQLQKDLEILQFEKQRIEKSKDDYRKQVLGLQSRMVQSEQKYLNQRIDQSRLFTETSSAANNYLKSDEILKSPLFKKKTKQAVEKQVSSYKKHYNVRLKNLENQLSSEKNQVYSLQLKNKNPQLPFIQFTTTGGEDGWKEK